MKILFFLSFVALSLWPGPAVFGQQTGERLEQQAWDSYEKGYDERLSREEQAKHFDEAARLYEEAAKAYEKIEQSERAEGARKMANGARQNAKHRRNLNRTVSLEQQVVSTGRTTGHIADLVLTNPDAKPTEVALPASVVIPSGGQYQGYAIPITAGKVTVPAGQIRTLALNGYCTHPDLPAAPPGTPLPGLTDWPPTVLPTPKTVHTLETTARRLHDRGVIQTPFDDPGIVVQHTFWDLASTGYDPCARLRQQMEDAGVPQDAIPTAIAQVVNAMLTTGREAGLPGYQPTLPILPVRPAAPMPTTKDQPKVTVTGTGRTTGHIADITVSNPSKQPITVVIGGGGAAYIPPTGQHQPYVIPSLPVIPVPPKGTVTVPVEGYCADVRRPPVPAGNVMPPVSEWITPHPNDTAGRPTAGRPSLPPDVTRIPTRTAPPMSQVADVLNRQPLPPAASKWDCPPLPPVVGQVLVPGTNIPTRAPVSVSDNPGLAVPILLDAIRRIADAYDQLRGTLATPFSNNPPKEREAIIQQTFWIFTSGLEGKPYVYKDFHDNTVKQFEDNTGQPYNSLPPDQKEKLDKGVDDFWMAFSAVGVEAKILPKTPEKPAPNTTPPVIKGKPRASTSETQPTTPTVPSTPVTGPGRDNPPPPEREKEEARCHLSHEARSIPPYDIQLDISKSAVDPAKIQKAKRAMENIIRDLIQRKRGEYGAPAPLATTYSVWAINHIGGYANAVSKAMVSNKYGFWNGFINNTEKLNTSAKGERILVMKGRNDKECKTTVVGVGVVSLTAHTVAFDPTARGIEFLRGINFVGKVAMEIAKAYLTGGASLANATRVKKAIKKAMGTVAKEEVTKQIGKILESEGAMSEEDFSNLVEWIEALKDNEVKEKIVKDLAEAMGIDTKWLTFDLEPADFAPVASDTYCKIRGSIDLTVGSQSGSLSAASQVLYKRSSLDEDPENVMKGGGTHCPPPLILSDVQPGSLTIRLKGLAETEAQAQGNGTAQGFLSSSVVLVQYGICVCPDGWGYDLQVENGYFSGKPGNAGINMMQIRLDILEQEVNDYIKTYAGQQAPPDPKAVQKDLEKLVRAWADEYACKE